MEKIEKFILSEEQKLEMLFNFFYELKFYKHSVESTTNNWVDGKFATLAFMTALYDYEGFPQVLSDDEYEKSNNLKLFRGTSKNEFNANILADFNYHHGYGSACNGIYSSTSKTVASSYAMGNETNVLSFKFNGKAIEFKALPFYMKCLRDKRDFSIYEIKDISNRNKIMVFKNFIKEFINSPSYKSKEAAYKTTFDSEPIIDFLFSFAIDRSLMAIYLGYDAITCNQDTYYQSILLNDEEPPLNVIILNRATIEVSQSEFDRICNRSRKYKGGVIDFDKKSINQFLNESDFMQK